jgi:hypothetical protein
LRDITKEISSAAKETGTSAAEPKQGEVTKDPGQESQS